MTPILSIEVRPLVKNLLFLVALICAILHMLDKPNLQLYDRWYIPKKNYDNTL